MLISNKINFRPKKKKKKKVRRSAVLESVKCSEPAGTIGIGLGPNSSLTTEEAKISMG